jgi:cytochrome c-type biogenesis protein
MLPVYFIYLAGTPEKEAEDLSGKGRLLLNSIGFVIGFTLVFVSLGATATTLGQFLSGHRALLQKVSGIIMVIFGLNFIGILKMKFLNVEKKLHFNFKKLRFLSSIVFGLVFGLGWTPCVGVFLGSAVLLAGNSDTILQGMLLLLLYSVGLGIPFIL